MAWHFKLIKNKTCDFFTKCNFKKSFLNLFSNKSQFFSQDIKHWSEAVSRALALKISSEKHFQLAKINVEEILASEIQVNFRSVF